MYEHVTKKKGGFLLQRKKSLLIPSLLIVGTLTACNTNTAMDTNRTASPYTNVTDNTLRNNDNYRHVGESTVDRNYRYNNNNGHNYGNVSNNNTTTNRYRRVTYDTNITEKINRVVRNVKGVEKAQSIIYGDNILVAVTTDTNDYRPVEKNIKNAVDDYVNEKDVEVIFGETNYQKLTEISKDINDGRDMDLDDRIRNSFRDVRNNVRRGVNKVEDSRLDIVPNNR